MARNADEPRKHQRADCDDSESGEECVEVGGVDDILKLLNRLVDEGLFKAFSKTAKLECNHQAVALNK